VHTDTLIAIIIVVVLLSIAVIALIIYIVVSKRLVTINPGILLGFIVHNIRNIHAFIK